MMSGTDAQQRGFKDRLTRISKGGPNTTRHVHIGPSAEAVGGRKNKTRDRMIRVERKRTFFGEIFVVPFALLAGLVAILAARVLTFHYLGKIEVLDTTIGGIHGQTIAAGVIALVLLMAFRSVLNFKGGARGKAILVGFLAMALFEDVAVVRAPDLFSLLYSQPYVADVVATHAS
jgi:hypothetical protein